MRGVGLAPRVCVGYVSINHHDAFSIAVNRAGSERFQRSPARFI